MKTERQETQLKTEQTKLQTDKEKLAIAQTNLKGTHAAGVLNEIGWRQRLVKKSYAVGINPGSMAKAIAQYQSKIDLLESEIDELRSLLAQYEAPALPEGSSFEIILIRHCMELLLRKRVVCEFKGVAVDPDGYVVARLKPQDGGQKAIEKWLTRDNIFHAVAQTELYTFYGTKLMWVFPKRRVVVGLAPTDPSEYEQASQVARDFRRMGVEVIFLNEVGLGFEVPEIGGALLIAGIIILVVAITTYFFTKFL